MEKVLILVDVQNAYINKFNESILKKIDKLLKSGAFSEIIATKFVNGTEKSIFEKELNYKISEEGKEFSLDIPKNAVIIEKNSYAFPQKDFAKIKKLIQNKEIYLCGVDYCCCVFAIAFQLFDAGISFKIFEDAVATCSNRSVDFPEMKQVYERNFGKNCFIKTEEFL